MEEWEAFFSGQVAASAALAGLLFVALSINLDTILAFPGLPARAGVTLVTLSTVLIASTALLAPGQSVRAYGAEVLAIGVIALVLVAVLQWRSYRAHPPALLAQELSRASIVFLAHLPFVIAGAVLLAGWEGGVYWMLPAVIFSFLSVLLNSWVLLIEIKR